VDFLRTDGTSCQGEMNAALFTDADGNPGGFIAVMRDITERKKMQASLIQSDRMASLGMLAAGVAHEINNPLSYVLFNAQRLEEDLQKLKNGPAESDPSDILLDCARQVAEGARRVRDIVRDLKTFACVEEDRRGPTTLLPAIDTAIQLAQNEIKYRAAIIRKFEDTRPVVANQGRLVQVFLNLLINAAQAIDEGDVENNEIRVRTWSEGEYSLVEVRDTGRGIAPEHLDRLFDPFFTTKPVGVGSGLGLPICHSIISSLGGSIEATSEPGDGTSMIVRLPALLVEDNPEPETQPPGGEKDAGPRARGRILIVDDEPMVGAVIRQMLEGEHEVQVAGSGHEGIQLLRENPQFDVILCDLIMPDVSGMDVHEWLAERSPELIRRMVFITGGAFTPAAKEFVQKSRNILVDKPIESDALRALVRDLVITNRAETPRGEL
jgi:nitrogen-specific signal transduction histidine kinase/CheY-like chemotaxis protein